MDKWTERQTKGGQKKSLPGIAATITNFCEFVGLMQLVAIYKTATKKVTHTYTHPFNGPLSGTNWVSRYQKGKTNLNFTEATDSEW